MGHEVTELEAGEVHACVYVWELVAVVCPHVRQHFDMVTDGQCCSIIID